MHNPPSNWVNFINNSSVYGWLGVIIPLIATIVIYLISRKKKGLSYLLISDTSVVSISEEFSQKVSISYVGLEAKTLQLVRFKIINIGNQPIRSEDFEEPLTFVKKATG